MRTLLARELEQIAKSGRRNKAGDRTLTLQECILRDRRAEADERDLGAARACHRQDFAEALERREMRIVRRRRQLVTRDRAALLVKQEQVGESAADVDAD